MIVYTDSVAFAGQVLPEATGWAEAALDPELAPLARRLYGPRIPSSCAVPSNRDWPHVFLVETAPASQFDLLVELGRGAAPPPDGTLCLAGRGERFHGFRNRPWTAAAGNIHLSAHFAPATSVARPDVAFTVLAAVSVVDAIDMLPGLAGRAGIKWVNDVLIDGAKVSGVLAHTGRHGRRLVGAALGIGLNVETVPDVDPTPFVPRAGALREVTPDAATCRRDVVLRALLAALSRNYRRLIAGRTNELIDRYRRRSIVLGREAIVCAEATVGVTDTPEVIAAGRVLEIGDDLALTIAGHDAPVCRGRLILDDVHLSARSGAYGTA